MSLNPNILINAMKNFDISISGLESFFKWTDDPALNRTAHYRTVIMGS